MLPDPSSVQTQIQSIQQLLRESLGSRRFQNWFGGSTKLELQETELTVHVQGPYLVKWIQQQCGNDFLRIVSEVVGPAATIRYEVGQEVVLSEIPEECEQDAQPVGGLSRSTAEPSVAKKRRFGRRSRTLNDFVLGIV